MTTVLNKETIRWNWKDICSKSPKPKVRLSKFKEQVRKRENLLNENIKLNADGTVDFKK